MKDAAPVRKLAASSRTAASAGEPARAASAGARSGRASSPTAAASARLSAPAVRNAPGRPSQAISTKPLASTPSAAPRLFVKYSIATDSPEDRGCARARPALIRGNVAPSSTDCGRISRLAMPSLAASTAQAPPSAGSSDAKDQPVRAVKASWKPSAASPITASARA